MDNGKLRRAFPGLGLAAGEGRTYHLLPVGVSKGAAAARYLERRGLEPHQAAAIGDSTADLELGAATGAMFLVGNATPDTVAAAPADAIVTDRAAGDGWAQAVQALLTRM
jgi:hydroxymethylpyrimidine pyrophosphatase-like HAD family hydrolase